MRTLDLYRSYLLVISLGSVPKGADDKASIHMHTTYEAGDVGALGEWPGERRVNEISL